MDISTLETELAAKNEVNTKAYNALVAYIKNLLEANIDTKVAEVSRVTDSMAEIRIKVNPKTIRRRDWMILIHLYTAILMSLLFVFCMLNTSF